MLSHSELLNKNNIEMEDNAYKLKAASCMPFYSCLMIMSVISLCVGYEFPVKGVCVSVNYQCRSV